MGIEDIDELEVRRNGSQLPPALPDNASLEEVIDAINGLRASMAELAKASKSHGVELGGIRSAFQAQGTRIETFCRRIERAMHARQTDPPPAGEAT